MLLHQGCLPVPGHTEACEPINTSKKRKHWLHFHLPRVMCCLLTGLLKIFQVVARWLQKATVGGWAAVCYPCPTEPLGPQPQKCDGWEREASCPVKPHVDTRSGLDVARSRVWGSLGGSRG